MYSDELLFNKILYRISYFLCGLFIILGAINLSFEMIGICAIFLIIGWFFDIKCLIYKIKNK